MHFSRSQAYKTVNGDAERYEDRLASMRSEEKGKISSFCKNKNIHRVSQKQFLLNLSFYILLKCFWKSYVTDQLSSEVEENNKWVQHFFFTKS